MSSCATEEVCFEEFCILKERNEKKKGGEKGNSTLLKTIKRDNALNTANDHSSKRMTRVCQRRFNSARFPAYRCTEWMHACMHAQNGCNKVFSDTCNGRTHSHSPLYKIFRLDVVAMLVISSVCMRHGRTTIGERDENHDPDGRKQ